ncbi:MAG TPA: T4 RnlA family RNA ligase [Candidatus Aquilonibacter sp.]|nr:T4 RnlA family RNA ligase [Candidatus Aquilonibacter sp.]
MKGPVSEIYGSHADLAALNERVEKKLISRKEHPSMPGVLIYNYTPVAQYETAWDDHVLQARGLVCRHDGEIIARCLPKFFNHDEVESLPWHLPFEITTKMDGSMFLLRELPSGERITATRGSFMSEQAEAGRALLERLYQHVVFDPAVTYIFELIHPLFRIVVDYGQRTDLVLLAMIETATGRELPLAEAPTGVSVVDRHACENIGHGEHLLALEEPNAEGFVVRFADGTRAKVKFAEYKRLHRLVTGVSNRVIWEYLRDGRDVSELLDRVPDEFNDWARAWLDRLRGDYFAMELNALSVAKYVADAFPTRKDQAVHIMTNAKVESAVIFKILDGKPYGELIWKLLEPAYEPPPFAARAEAA